MKTTLKSVLLSSTLLLVPQAQANFDFGECQGSGTFEQLIAKYQNYEDVLTVGEIPAGIKGLKVSLTSDKDVDIRLYGENEDKIVHWPYGLLNKSGKETKPYHGVNVTYSGYNGVGGELGHEYIEVNGTTPVMLTMKAFGYRTGYATVNYSWTGKEGCTASATGEGNFTQTLHQGITSLVGTIPPHVNNLEINLTSISDLDIQLYAQDGTAIASWQPTGLMAGAGKQSIMYHDMNITWSGYNGTHRHKGNEYITVTGETSEILVMKVFGYESGEADVRYRWGDVQNNELKTLKDIYNPNDLVSVKVDTVLSGDQDWVGVYPKNAVSNWTNVISWNWVQHNGTIALSEIKKNMPAGAYDARLFFHNNFEKKASYAFTVGEDLHTYPPETLLNKIVVDRVNRPAEKFSSYIDMSFDNTVKRTVTRLTNREQDNKGFNGHQYPKQGSAWNSDMSLLRLAGRVYDAESLQEIPLTKNKSGNDVYHLLKSPESGTSGIRWSKHNPNVLYVMSSTKKFYKLTINANRTSLTEELIIDLSNTPQPYFNIGEDEGNIDYEDKYVILTSIDGNDVYATLLDIKAKQLVWGPRKLDIAKDRFDWISISPSGNYILINEFKTAKDSKIHLYNRNLEKIRTLANYSQHGDICYDQNGNEMYVQLRSGGRGIFGFALNNNHQTEEPIKLLDSNYGGGHVSCRNYQRKGWAYVSTREDGYREVFALKLDGSKKVQRFAKTNARGSEDPILGDDEHYHYATYPTGVPSPDGTRILFWSDYGNPEEFLYVYKDNDGSWHTTNHYDNRDTYQVRITK